MKIEELVELLSDAVDTLHAAGGAPEFAGCSVSTFKEVGKGSKLKDGIWLRLRSGEEFKLTIEGPFRIVRQTVCLR